MSSHSRFCSHTCNIFCGGGGTFGYHAVSGQRVHISFTTPKVFRYHFSLMDTELGENGIKLSITICSLPPDKILG